MAALWLSKHLAMQLQTNNVFAVPYSSGNEWQNYSIFLRNTNNETLAHSLFWCLRCFEWSHFIVASVSCPSFVLSNIFDKMNLNEFRRNETSILSKNVMMNLWEIRGGLFLILETWMNHLIFLIKWLHDQMFYWPWSCNNSLKSWKMYTLF